MPPARRWLLDTILLSLAVGAVELLVVRILQGIDAGISENAKANINALALAFTIGPLFAWLLYRQHIEARLAARESFRSRRVPGSPHRRVRIAVLGSLTVIAALVGVSLWGRLTNVRNAYHDGESLLLAGRQRALTERIARVTSRTTLTPRGAYVLDSLTQQLQREARTLHLLLETLTESRLESAGNAYRSMQASDTVRATLLVASQELADSTRTAAQHEQSLVVAQGAAEKLQPIVERVAVGLEAYGRERSRSAIRVAWLVASLLALCIVLIALYVIEPVVQLLRRQHEFMTTQSRRLEHIVQSADLGTWEWDLRTNQVVFNEQWAALLGYNHEEIAPTLETWRALSHPDDLRAVKKVMVDHLKGLTPEYRCEQRLRRADGTWCWALAAGRVIERDAKGRALRAVGVHLDVSRAREAKSAIETARASAESALREVSALRAALDEHSILSVSDRAGRMIDVNTGFCRASGYSRAELIGSDHRLLSSDTHSNAFWEELWATVTLGRPWRGEICNRRKDGTLYWVDSTIIPYVGADGTIEKYVTIRFDVTAQKRADEALQRTTDLLEEAQSVARLGSWSVDLRNNEVTWSREMYRLYGRRELDGPPTTTEMVRYYVAEDAERLSEVGRRTLSDGLPYSMVVRMRAGANGVRHVRAQGRARRNGIGRIVGLFGTVMDVTAEIEREEALRLAQSRAEAASRSKSEFLANMSHEIRTPLTAILGYTDLLRAEHLDEQPSVERLPAIDTIRRAGEHLLGVINDILDVSKIEAGRLLIEQVDLELPQLLIDVDRLMRARATPKGISLRTVLTSPIPSRILSDPTRVRQILLNLVGNAVKFTEIGGVEIRVGVIDEATVPQLRIAVEDTGPGLTAEQSAQLFEAFSQADTSVTRRHGGTGLGLTICRRLATLMNGTVTLTKTEPGRGSCFELTMPLVSSPHAVSCVDLELTLADKATARGVVPVVASLTGRVLIAEDGEDNQRLIAHHLTRAGAQVTVVDNGVQALAAIRAADAEGAPFSLLVTDMQMPEMDGYSLARALRADGNRIAIVALTAHAMADDRQKCLAAGCNDYVSKPIDRVVLLAACARWIEASDVAPVLLSELRDDPDMGDIVAQFVRGLPARLDTIAASLATNDLEEVARRAHQMKGAAGGYGFPTISDAAREVEACARAARGGSDAQRVFDALVVLCHAAVRGCDGASEHALSAGSAA